MDITPDFKTSLGKGANKILIDDVSETVSYIGNAQIGSDEGFALWMIRRLTQVGTSFKIEYAEGSVKFDKIWNDRALYTYE